MKKQLIQLSLVLISIAMLGLTACQKSSSSTPTFPKLQPVGQVSGTWTENSVVTINKDIVVPKGKSLTIDAGTHIIFSGDSLGTAAAPELQVRGNLYVKGTKDNPVVFTIPAAQRTVANRYKGMWGGIQCAHTSDEVSINYATIEYAGAPAGPNSVFVEQGQTQGDPRFALLYGNTSGKIAVYNSLIQNTTDDAVRVTGGKMSLCNNTFAYIGETGGEAMNIKSGVLGDMAFNIIYSSSTNGPKWSNEGDLSPQTDCDAYNNTMVNCGWRRNKSGRGGSVNIEKGGRGKSYNNLIVNCKYGVRVVGGSSIADTANFVNDYNWYFGNEQMIVDEFYPDNGILTHADSPNDVIGAVNENNPQFVGYDVSTGKMQDMALNTLDFHLKSTSPALTGAYTNFTPRIGSLTIGDTTFTTPMPAAYFGALGTR